MYQQQQTITFGNPYPNNNDPFNIPFLKSGVTITTPSFLNNNQAAATSPSLVSYSSSDSPGTIEEEELNVNFIKKNPKLYLDDDNDDVSSVDSFASANEPDDIEFGSKRASTNSRRESKKFSKRESSISPLLNKKHSIIIPEEALPPLPKKVFRDISVQTDKVIEPVPTISTSSKTDSMCTFNTGKFTFGERDTMAYENSKSDVSTNKSQNNNNQPKRPLTVSFGQQAGSPQLPNHPLQDSDNSKQNDSNSNNNNNVNDPNTLHQRSPSSDSISTVSTTSTSSDQKRRSDASYMDTNGTSPIVGPTPGTDPTIIHAITQTMIGEYLWKYTRRNFGAGISEKRHKRFFWVHPYTKTLYWSSKDPGNNEPIDPKIKSGMSYFAYIESVRQVVDHNPSPPGLHHMSLIIKTPERELKFTAQSKERHYENSKSDVSTNKSQNNNNQPKRPLTVSFGQQAGSPQLPNHPLQDSDNSKQNDSNSNNNNNVNDPNTLHQRSPSSDSISTVSTTSTSSDQKRRSDASYMDTNGTSPIVGPTPGTDPTIIHAITQTMIGEYLWKYTRRNFGAGISEKRHKRFFWVHPYTKTLYWSSKDPGNNEPIDPKIKSGMSYFAYIESVRQVVDHNPSPPGLHHMSLIIKTPERELKFTAQSKERQQAGSPQLPNHPLQDSDNSKQNDSNSNNNNNVNDPNTLHQRSPSSDSISTVSTTSTSSDQKRRSDASYMDTNGTSPIVGPTPGTDPTIIHAITQTMIGEYLWKYTRRNFGAGISEKRHKRFFWVHPYTKTLYWSSKDPGNNEPIDPKIKSGMSYFAYIESVRQVVDHNPSPPGLHHMSLIIKTPERELKFTAQSKERHEYWFQALNYLLQRPEDSMQNEAWDGQSDARNLNINNSNQNGDNNIREIKKKSSFSKLQSIFRRDENVRQCCDGKHDIGKLEHHKHF
ncbi:8333_t:CDS:10 [Entrophospora sp. SA101]|nr:8333_t:CDS:10 [Entrophospora sp. SA101]